MTVPKPILFVLSFLIVTAVVYGFGRVIAQIVGRRMEANATQGVTPEPAAGLGKGGIMSVGLMTLTLASIAGMAMWQTPSAESGAARPVPLRRPEPTQNEHVPPTSVPVEARVAATRSASVKLASLDLRGINLAISDPPPPRDITRRMAEIDAEIRKIEGAADKLKDAASQHSDALAQMQSMLQQRSRLAAQCKIAREKLNAVKGVDRTTPEVIGFYETTVSSCDRSLVELVEPIVFNAKALATHLELELQKNIAYTEARLSHLAVLQIERSVLEVLVKTGSN